jgi:hypothetical protein
MVKKIKNKALLAQTDTECSINGLKNKASLVTTEIKVFKDNPVIQNTDPCEVFEVTS